MSMSKKNYQEFANIINSHVSKGEIDIPVDELINDLCNYFSVDNSKFNAQRFFEACKK